MVYHDSRAKPRPTSADQAIAALASRQHGLITAAQLIGLGVTRRVIGYRVDSGRLHPVHRGVYAVGHRALGEHARLHAAVLAIGSDAVLSHLSAAGLWGLVRPAPQRRVEVTTTRRLTQRRAIRLHVTQTLPRRDVTRTYGIPVTTPARTLLDLAGAVPPNVLRRALREAEVQRLIDSSTLPDSAHGRDGAARLRELAAPGPTPTRSELEDRTLELLTRHGFPAPQVNATLRIAGSSYEVDFLFHDHRVIVEADGERYHATPLARRHDAARQAVLEAAGYRVLRLTWAQVTRDENQTAARLRRILPAAARA